MGRRKVSLNAGGVAPVEENTRNDFNAEQKPETGERTESTDLALILAQVRLITDKWLIDLVKSPVMDYKLNYGEEAISPVGQIGDFDDLDTSVINYSLESKPKGDTAAVFSKMSELDLEIMPNNVSLSRANTIRLSTYPQTTKQIYTLSDKETETLREYLRNYRKALAVEINKSAQRIQDETLVKAHKL